MFRYFAVYWKDKSQAAGARARGLMNQLREQSPSWRSTVDVPGLLVACAGATGTQRAYVLRDEGSHILGVVLGDLFSHSTRCSDLTRAEAECIFATQGRELVRRYWGNYVALLHDSRSGDHWVLRAPAATLPCFHVSLADIDLYFSWTEACAALNCIPFNQLDRCGPRSERPVEIIERRRKGGAEHIAWRLLRQNLAFIRELLLDGQLVHAGIIDRPRLEAALDAAPSSTVKATVPVFHLVGAEAWLQAWS